MTNTPRLTLFLAALLTFFNVFFLYQPVTTIDSYDKRKITYFGSRIKSTKMRRSTSRKIVIDSDIGELILSSHGYGFFPANTSLEEAVTLINQSFTATVWLLKDTHNLRGIESKTFNISPEKGLYYDREGRKLYLIVSTGLIAYTLSLYFFYVIKKQISWKLELIKPEPPTRRFNSKKTDDQARRKATRRQKRRK